MKLVIAPPRFLRLDAAESAFFARELEHVMAEVYNTQFPGLDARKFLPPWDGIAPGAETVVYQQFTAVGRAKVIGSYADDLPRVDTKGEEVRSPIKEVADSFGYNVHELEASIYARRDLPRQKAMDAREAIDRQMDEIALLGHSATGLEGLFNHSDVTPSNVVDAGGGDTEWDSDTKLADPTLILDDLNEPFNTIAAETKGVERLDTVILPSEKYELIASKMLPQRDTTVLEAFKKAHPEVTVMSSWRLAGAGAGNTDRAVFYTRNKSKIGLAEPLMFQQLPPQERGLEFVVACRARTGGVILPYPKSVIYRDAI